MRNISATIRRPTVHYRTLGEHFDPFPSPKGAAPHALATFLPHSVAQGCRAARSGNTSAPFRRPTVPRSTPGEHFCHYPSPNSALPHARGTLRPVSVTQGCRAARSGNISATIRRPTVHYRTLGEHFDPFPSPKGAAPHARGTFLPLSVARWCISARPGNTSATIHRPTVPRRTPGRHLRPFPSPGRAGQGKRTGMAEYGGRTGGGAGPESGPGQGKGRGQEKAKGRERGRAQIE